MRITLPRVTAVAFLMVAAPSPSAELYQCQDTTGCVATFNGDDGIQKKVVFRKGDIVSTDAGWVVSTNEGWVKLRSRDN